MKKLTHTCLKIFFPGEKASESMGKTSFIMEEDHSQTGKENTKDEA